MVESKKSSHRKNPLEEPLLSKTRMGNSGESWPTAAAAASKLHIPDDWLPSNIPDDYDGGCFVRYDASKDLILLVTSSSTGEEEILDVISPKDVIGANLELFFSGADFGSFDEGRRVGFKNEKSRTLQSLMDKHDDGIDDDDSDDDDNNSLLQKKSVVDGSSNASCTNIFSALQDDMDRVFTCKTGNGDAPGGGCTVLSSGEIPFDSQAVAYLNIYCYPQRRPSQEGWLSYCGITSSKPPIRCPKIPPPIEDGEKLGNRYAHHRRFEVVAGRDFSHIQSLVRGIRSVAKLGQFQQNTTPGPAAVPCALKYLVIVNPKGGTGTGEDTYLSTVGPMLEQAGVEHDLCITTHARHAEERVKEGGQGSDDKDLADYDGLVCLGGDGILHEVFQGVKTRNDADEIFAKLKIGIVGCGTSNGLAMSLLHESGEQYGALDSTFLVCKGQTTPMDLSHYSTQNREYTSFLTFSWAFIADVDIESETIRCLGRLRNDVWAAWRAVWLRKYRARFSYLPPSKVLNYKTTGLTHMPSLSDDIPAEDWVTIEDNFILFWAAHVSHASYATYNSPASKMQDGVFQIMVIRPPISKFQLIKLLLGIETGAHVNNPHTEFFECVAYRLEPVTSGSFNDLDGEVIESGPIQGHVLPASTNMFCGV